MLCAPVYLSTSLLTSDKPKVTSLTVDGREVDSDHLISEGKNVTVACSFDNGNPPAPFRLLDKSGQILRNISNEGNVSYSFAVTCEDDWPIIGCEGAGSEFNRSVSFLVRCKFVCVCRKLHEPITFKKYSE